MFFIGAYVVHKRISDVDTHFVLFIVEHVDTKHTFIILRSIVSVLL